MEQEQYDFTAGMSKASCLRELEQADRTRLQSSGAWRLALVYLGLGTPRSCPSTSILSFDSP